MDVGGVLNVCVCLLRIDMNCVCIYKCKNNILLNCKYIRLIRPLLFSLQTVICRNISKLYDRKRNKSHNFISVISFGCILVDFTFILTLHRLLLLEITSKGSECA